MRARTLHALKLAVAAVGQTVLLAAGLGFFAVVVADGPLIVPDALAVLMHSKPTVTTWITTLLATGLSLATTTFLSIAFKEALRHRMHKPISLVRLSGGIALARNSFLVNSRHLTPTLVTLVVFGLTKLLVSSWTALLAPALVVKTISASGWELDLTSSAFESMLQQELVQSGAALVRGNSSEIIDVGGVLSGITAAQYSFGTPGIFNFNGAKYNISTGGVLPAAPSYGGTTSTVSLENTALAFAGGLVPTHLDVNYPGNHTLQGLSREYTLQQQGLTANVSCNLTSITAKNLNSSFSVYPLPVSLANGPTSYWLWAWNVTADCSEGQLSQQQYVTRSDSFTDPVGSSTGFISSLVCPYPIQQTGFSWERFAMVTNASGYYGFLSSTVCNVDLLVTTSLVQYSNDVINTTVIHSTPLGSGNTNLTLFLAAIVDYQSRTTQGLTSNIIGDALYTIFVSASSDNSTSTEDTTNILLNELEQYWRGVIEFSGTFLRSAFSAYPRTIPVDAQIALSGNETITTMGWHHRSVTSGYTIAPITIVALMVYAAVAYTLWHVFVKRGHESFMTFDPSNPIHLMMVSSARDGTDIKENDHLGEALGGFERREIARNENVRVQLASVASARKMFRMTRD